ncbi:MAG: nucleoside hydrolase, partial [Ginsengibacter sp.]
AKYHHTIKNNSEVPDAVELYRKILAQQPDNSVTIVTIGFLTNISNLLQSGPDHYSSLNGSELVKKKVRQLVCMAGKFPKGYEFNVKEDARASRYVFEHWQKPVLFSGFEIGQKIKTGLPLIHTNSIKNSPVKDVFRICIPMAKEDSVGRMSWDESAVLIAVEGYRPFYKTKTGTIIVNEDGSNAWSPSGNNQSYLVEDSPISDVQNIINTLMMHQPK